MDRFQLSQPPRTGPASRQMGYPNQMPPQSQRNNAPGAANAMMSRAQNGRPANAPSWGSTTPTAQSQNFPANPLQRPPSSGPFPNDPRADTHLSAQRAAQSFREDDFPALGAGMAEPSNIGSGSYAAISNGTGVRGGPAPDNASFDDFPSLPGMLNSEVKGMPSLNPQSGSPMPYISAAGAATNATNNVHGTSHNSNTNLQQHRSSLLGAMTLGRNTPNSQQNQQGQTNTPTTGNLRDTQQQQSGPSRNINSQDPRYGRAINAPPNLSLMNGPPALGGTPTDGPPGTQQHQDEPPTPRTAAAHQHTRDRGGDLSVPTPSHAPGLSSSTALGPREATQKAQEVAPVEEEEPLTEVEKYTIKGLLPIIRQSNTDASMLALGSDLTNLGLKLAADDDRLLSSLWSSPWTDSPNLTTLPEPHWRVPSCYTNDMQGVLPPADLKIGNFAEETLFYIFYTQPRDRMQELAAQELTHRNWRFHKSLGLWLTKEPGIEPQLRTASMERGTYVFWDTGRWERVKKVFELYYEDLEDRFSVPTSAGAGPQSQQHAGNSGNGKIVQDRGQ